MSEEEILLHTFRDGEELVIDGTELQNLLRHKNSLVNENRELNEKVEALYIALEAVKGKLDTCVLSKPRKAHLTYNSKGIMND